MTATARGTVVRRAVALPFLLALLVVPMACSNPVDRGQRPTLAGTDTVVGTHAGFFGLVVSDGAGRTLYQFANDQNGQSSCYDACATTWKPYLATGEIQLSNPNMNALEDSQLKAVPRQGSNLPQVSYSGHPLYYFDGDHNPGDVLGVGQNQFGGRWAATSTLGAPVAP